MDEVKKPAAVSPKGKWFHPKTLLDKTYEIGLLLKGINGGLELLGGLLILVVPATAIDSLTRWLTQGQLAENPNDFIANHILHYGHELAHGQTTFAVLFLLTHGVVKVGLVIALLRQKMWAYPWALVLLGLFLVYQAYLLITQPSFGMAFLTVLDVIIIGLIWREWRLHSAKHG